MLISALIVALALLLPNWWLREKLKRRQMRLRNAFPDALDMLVICVEAGLGLSAAMERVTDEIRNMHPDLATEFAAVNAEVRSGVERGTALRSLNVRTGLLEIRGFVSLLTQTLQLGTGVGNSLRIYAEDFRDQRMQRAENQAAKIGTKMIFPLVFCEFPAFFLIAIGPAILRILDSFGA
jgi:tight adherence protein C